jgi:hypothetical protein
MSEDEMEGLRKQLGEQANAIGRLTKHIAWHHNELNMHTAETCSYNQSVWSGFQAEEEQEDGSTTQADGV